MEEWSEDADGASDVANDIRYCGYRFDNESGLYHVRHRYLHPTLGRWLSRDPLEGLGRANRYEYCRGSPARGLDSSGLVTIDPPSDPGVFPLPRVHVPRIDITLPSHADFCYWLESEIRCHLGTREGIRALNRFFSGTGQDIWLTRAEVEDAMSGGQEDTLEKRLDELKEKCASGQEWGLASETIRENLGHPWDEPLGHVDFELNHWCKSCCLTWGVFINDYYDFDPRGPFTDRSWKNEFRVTLVWGAQVTSGCGWKEFYHRGVAGGEEGEGCTQDGQR